MSRLNVFMFPLSPDYSGAAAALFDLGGITIMHDASGCTGNYTGYDEPRWLGSRTATYCSGLRRMDAVLGNDEKYIRRVVRAAEELKPSVICYLGSPVPILIGTDLKGMARETEAETGIPSFGFETSGQGYYDKGASDVFLALTKRFCKGRTTDEREGLKVNLLGMLPIDFGNRGNLREIPDFLKSHGMTVIANYAAGLTVDQIRRAADADWNLVMSRSGLALAKYMEKKYGIPWFCGVPVGDGSVWLRTFSERRAERDHSKEAGETRSAAGKTEAPAAPATEGRGILIIHEQVFANSLRENLRAIDPTLSVRVGVLTGLEPELAEAGDLNLNLETDLMRELNSGSYGAVIGDPELSRVIRRDDLKLIALPHIAVSSKLHWDEIPSWLGDSVPKLLQDAVGSVG